MIPGMATGVFLLLASSISVHVELRLRKTTKVGSRKGKVIFWHWFFTLGDRAVMVWICASPPPPLFAFYPTKERWRNTYICAHTCWVSKVWTGFDMPSSPLLILTLLPPLHQQNIRYAREKIKRAQVYARHDEKGERYSIVVYIFCKYRYSLHSLRACASSQDDDK